MEPLKNEHADSVDEQMNHYDARPSSALDEFPDPAPLPGEHPPIRSSPPPPLTAEKSTATPEVSIRPLTPSHEHDEPSRSQRPHAEIITYPEGGLRAYLVVLGSFSGMVASFGLMNTIGTFQAYLSTHQLSDYSPSTVGWIFSLYIFLAFFCGVQIGPIFDSKGARLLVLSGSVCLVAGMMGVASSTGGPPLLYLYIVSPISWVSVFQIQLAKFIEIQAPLHDERLFGICLTQHLEYWHFLVTFSVLGGIGTSLIFTPAVGCVAHHFYLSRAAATGLATTGGSAGGIIFPFMLERLFPRYGFPWATRIIGFIFLFLLLVANILIRTRLPPKPRSSTIWPDWTIFNDRIFTLTTAGVLFIEWGLFVPLGYISSYAMHYHLSPTYAYELLAIVNSGSFFGRWAPGFVADRIGRFNTMILMVLACMLCVLGVWLTAGGSMVRLCVFAVLFGFASGSNISLTPACVGQLCATEEFGRWYATCYTVVSFGCLTGLPIAGAILREGGEEGAIGYEGLVLFTGGCYLLGLICFVSARVGKVGWQLVKVY